MRRANGTGSIYKMTHKPLRKPYRVVITAGFTDDGKAIRKTVGTFKTAREAQECLKNYNGNPAECIRQDITFGQCWEWMLEDKKRAGVGLKPYTAARPRVEHLFKRQITDIRLADLQRIIDAHSHMSRSTIKVILKGLNGTYRAAAKNDIKLTNYPSLLVLPPEPENKEGIHKPYTPAEIVDLWEANDKMSKWQLIYIYTGMRPAELVNMELDNIHLKERYMIGGVKTKAGKNRIIPIAECIVPLLTDAYAKAKFKQAATLGKVMPAYKTYRLAISAANGHRPHDGRHTFATFADACGIDENIIKRILGHSLAANITQSIYTHKDTADLVAAVNKLPTYNDLVKVVQRLSNESQATPKNA